MSARLVAGAAAAVLFGAWLADATAAWRAARRKRLEWLAGGAALKARLLAMRRRDFCPAQSISYANTDPLLVVEGTGATLTDESGRRFLDTRNNVCHVGHAHPAVAAAVAQQVAVLNTNTRYLHMNVCGLARKLLDTMPAPLRDGVVFFVNSGSEANDLAVRLARTATGHERCVVVDHAYHGHTITALGLSPYKYEHRSFAGRGQPSWVTKCAAPDVYRGAHRGADAAERYAKSVEEACAAGDVAAFFIESGMSVAGVILPPPGYLARCYAAVRGAGGVCVADEAAQDAVFAAFDHTGLGRFGECWWGFEQQGVVPDIVTMGKPIGNGMPLAAVVCTRALSEAFSQGPEYFNTFGGNPVCTAAGLAVLETIAREDLRGNAVRVGAALRRLLAALAATDDGVLIGDVRGCGLFVGIDLVLDRQSRAPAPKQTSRLCSALKDNHRILTSIDGPHDNVLVLKPPLCFSEANAATLIAAMRVELKAMRGLDLSATTHTPT